MKLNQIYETLFAKTLNTKVLMKAQQFNQQPDHRKTKNLLMKCMLLSAFSLLCATSWAVEVSAGEDKVGCIGQEIEIGGKPTAAPEGMGPFKYTWKNSKGQVISTEANPKIIVGETEETYTVEVEDKDGFKCDDSMKVSPIKISKITFEPLKTLPMDGKTTTTAKATITPSGRTIKWKIEGDDLGCKIDESTGLITAGTKKGYLKVRAYDAEESDEDDLCYQEATLCVGEECCPPISGIREFGPLVFEVNDLQAKEQDDDGYCIYELLGTSINFKTKGKLPRDEKLIGVSVKWKEKTREDGTYEFSGVEIAWSGKEKTSKVGIFQAELTNLALRVSSSGALGGEVTFKINQLSDEKFFKGVVVLKKGTSGTFTYKYNNQNGFEGEFDFGGINNIVLHFEKNRKKLGSVTGSMTKDGKFNATLRYDPDGDPTFSSKGFTATLKSFQASVQYDIEELEGSLIGGGGEMEISKIANVKGKIGLGFTITPDHINASVSMTNGVEAFGCTVSGELTADMGYDLELNWIEGTNINAKHKELDQAFQGVAFKAELGKLTKFDIRFVEVKYKGIKFSIANGQYREGKGLELDAKLTAATLKLEVTDFRIDTEGVISFGKGKVNYTNTPLTLFGEASFQNNRFTGTYSGSVKGGIAIDGSLVVGGESDFNYGFFSAGLKVRGGILLGSSGFKMNKLLGEAGINWDPGSSFDGTGGTPSNGTSVFGAGIGITDAFFEMILLEGKGRVILGDDTGFGILGAVRIPAVAPHYFSSELGVTYYFGKEAFDATIQTSFNVPPVNGGLIKIESGPVNFRTSEQRWYLRGTGMNGKIFNQAEFSGSIDVAAPMQYISQLRGTASGSAKLEKTFEYRYPANFDPTNCRTADETDNIVGFGVRGTLKTKLEGSFSANFGPNGFDGSIELSVSGSNKMLYKFPCIITCGEECVEDSNLSISGKLNVQNQGSQIRIYGKGKFSDGNETEEGEIDVIL